LYVVLIPERLAGSWAVGFGAFATGLLVWLASWATLISVVEEAKRSKEDGAAADTLRLDWLERQSGAVLISDDAGRWAVTWVASLEPGDIGTTFLVEDDEWAASVRDAIDAAAPDE
jgi:hypothetical protein